MSGTNADLLSDALKAALIAQAPVGCTVEDHKVLPMQPEQIPMAGYLCVFLAEDQPSGDGYPDESIQHPRIATFKVAIRTKGDPTSPTWNILHATRPLRQVVAKAVLEAASLNGVTTCARLMGWRPQVVETTLSIGAAEMDVVVDYIFDPEVA